MAAAFITPLAARSLPSPARAPLSARRPPQRPASAQPHMRFRPEGPAGREPHGSVDGPAQHADGGAVRAEASSKPVEQFPLKSNLYQVDPSAVATDSEENLRGFIKTRGSLVPGEEIVFWWVGDIYDMVDEQTSHHLFSFEGYNIGRMVRVDGGWRLLTREVGLYKDKRTGEILDVWENPRTGMQNTCVHVWNDPVNQQFLLDSPNGKFKVPTTSQGDDIYWHAEVFLKYKSPLPRSEFPKEAASDTYQSVEMFQFFSTKEELSSEKPSADCLISWVRVGQWLPWMEMGDTPGRLVYHCRGRKLKSGYGELSETVRKYVEKHHPEYSAAPYNFTSPNETSWTYMRKLLEQKGSPRADGTIAKPEPKTAWLTDGKSEEKSTEEEESIQLTAEELSQFAGQNVDKPIYLSVGGLIFDVSTARRHYRRGETYNCLTGRDASYAFISGDLSEAGLSNANGIDLSNLTEQQQKDLDHWIGFFAKTYPQVGEFVGYCNNGDGN